MHQIETTDLSDLNDFLQVEGSVRVRDWLPADIDGPAVAALSRDQVVAAARAYRTWLHPQRWRLAIFVSPDWRRRRIGADLLRALVGELPERAPELQAAVVATDTAAIGFLDHAGFVPVMTTRLGSLDVSTIPVVWRERCTNAQHLLERHGIRIDTLESRPELFEDTALLHDMIYRDQHAWDQPRTTTPEDRIDLFMNDVEFDPAMQFLALKGNELCAPASLRHTQRLDRLDFGWIGTVDVLPKHRELLYRAFRGCCLDAAIRRNACIDIEIDHVVSIANAIVDEIPVRWDDAWLTYVRNEELRHE